MGVSWRLSSYQQSILVLQQFYKSLERVLYGLLTSQGFFEGSKEQTSASIGAASIMLGFLTMIIVILYLYITTLRHALSLQGSQVIKT